MRITKKGVTIVFAFAFLVIVALAVLSGRLPRLIGLVYAALSLITFVVYAFDKSAASSGAWRTPESTLHLMGIAGGWPGALIAQQALRHKSKKVSFRAVLWATILINGGVFVWLLTAQGRVILESLLR
jgi:uncharacterized membrane protein YsdA (DUF1294 family)